MTNTDTDEAEHIRRLQAAFRFFRKIEDRQSDSDNRFSYSVGNKKGREGLTFILLAQAPGREEENRASRMKRFLYILTSWLLCVLSGAGAAQLTLVLGLESWAAIVAGIAAFIGNFFMIEPPSL